MESVELLGMVDVYAYLVLAMAHTEMQERAAQKGNDSSGRKLLSVVAYLALAALALVK